MNFIRMVLISASAFLMFRCNGISNEINNSFEKVNKSLENSNRFSGDKLKYIYSKIDSNRINNPNLSMKADSVFKIVIATYNYIDSLKSVMLTIDSSGTLLGPSDKLLVNGPTGDILAKRLLSVSNQCYSDLVDDSSLPALNKTLEDINQIRTGKTWKNTYFHSTPTIAAVTILSKFQNDCKEGGIIVLTNIEKHISK